MAEQSTDGASTVQWDQIALRDDALDGGDKRHWMCKPEKQVTVQTKIQTWAHGAIEI